MDRATFEAELARDGYALREAFKPHTPANGMHVHDFDARLYVLAGEITLTREDGARTFRAGDSCDVPAGTLHSEAYGPEGCKYLAGRR